MKDKFKYLIFSLLSHLPRSRNGTILMYHSVGGNTAEFTVQPEMFARQLEYLIESRYQMLTLSTLIEKVLRKDPLAKCVSLTFDDGYADLYHSVFPLVRAHRIPVSIFLATGYVGGTYTTSRGQSFPMLDWEQIQEMHLSGLVEFLPHGRNHLCLDTLSPKEAHEEMYASLHDIEAVLGPVPRIYAYAKGRYTRTTIETLKKELFTAAVTVRPGMITHNSSLFELPRHHMDAHTTMPEFKARVRGSAIWFEWLKLGMSWKLK